MEESPIIFRYGSQRISLEMKEYFSGEPLMKYNNDIHSVLRNVVKNIKDISNASICVRPKTMNEFVGAMFWVDALVERIGVVPNLILPFVPGARQDRLMTLSDGVDFLFTAKSIAKMINDRNFPRVHILDPHSEVIAGMIDRCETYSPANILYANFFDSKPYAGIIAPDAGATKRASSVATCYSLPLFHGGKTRSIQTGEITNFWIHDLPQEGRFLVVDDICDGGGTFIGLAKVIEEQCPNVTLDLYVTHGLFSKGLNHLKEYFDNIITTDSVIGEKEGIDCINACHYMMGGK